MSIKKIPCGGFYYDDETIEFEDGVMKAIGGGSGGGGMVVTVNFDESFNGTADKTLDEIIATFDTGTFVSIKMLLSDAFYLQSPLQIGVSGGDEDKHISASLVVGEITLRCDSGTTWTLEA